MRIEIKKPQYLAAKAIPKAAVQETEEGEPGGLPGFVKFLLFLAYVFFGFAIWMAVRLFLKS